MNQIHTPIIPADDTPVAHELPRRVQLKWLAIAGGLLAAAGLAQFAASTLRHHDAPPPPPPPGVFRATPDQYAGLAIRTVAPGGLGAMEEASGQIAVDAEHSAPVVPPFSGQITKVFVEAGQWVRQGQPLMQIRAPEFAEGRDALLSAAAQNDAAQSQLRIAQANARRQQEIYESAGGALKDFQSAQNDLAAAQAGARSAQAALGAARDKLAVMGKTSGEIAAMEHAGQAARANPETVLTAPISGQVVSRAASAGQYIAAGSAQPLFMITDPRTLWLVADVAETDVPHIHLGDRVEVTTPAYPGRTFEARVDNVGAEIDPVTHRLPVRATIQNPDNRLKPDMFASFLFRSSGSGQGVAVPASAVIHEGDSARVWVARPGRVLEAREVVVGDSAGGMVHILKGLKAGERIVTAGAIFVNEAGSAQ